MTEKSFGQTAGACGSRNVHQLRRSVGEVSAVGIIREEVLEGKDD